MTILEHPLKQWVILGNDQWLLKAVGKILMGNFIRDGSSWQHLIWLINLKNIKKPGRHSEPSDVIQWEVYSHTYEITLKKVHLNLIKLLDVNSSLQNYGE